MDCQVQYEIALRLWMTFKNDRNPKHLTKASDILEKSLSTCNTDTGLVAKASWLYYVVMTTLDEANEKKVRKYAEYAITLDRRYSILDYSKVKRGALLESPEVR